MNDMEMERTMTDREEGWESRKFWEQVFIARVLQTLPSDGQLVSSGRLVEVITDAEKVAESCHTVWFCRWCPDGPEPVYGSPTDPSTATPGRS